jgi:glycosyltransferase A (GT-A) superfamily protein (DUF2064 family)
MTPVQVAVITKAPVPGAVKTRLCPPYRPDQAAGLAAAALADVVATVAAAPAARRVLLLDGEYPVPPGWDRVAQRGDGLAARLAGGFRDLARPGIATLIVAGDTPSLHPELLAAAVEWLGRQAEAVLGPTEDGGFWAIGLHDPSRGELLRTVPMSTPTTGADTLAALREDGLKVGLLTRLRDVDTPDDVVALAAAHPRTRFAAAVRRLAYGPVTAEPD